MTETQTLEHSVEAEVKYNLIDCDIHPAMKTPAELHPYLSQRWKDHLATYGGHTRQGLAETLSHPRMVPEVSRVDSWPPSGGPPGSDLPFLREQHLDGLGIDIGVLVPLRFNASGQRHPDLAVALATALNDWQLGKFLEPEPRLRGSIVVTQEDPASAVAEIDRRASDKRFVQVLLPPRSIEPLGKRRHWSIFEAAVSHGLPISLHVGGVGGHAATGAGWPSYYIEEHHSQVQTMQAGIASLIFEGVFESFPELKVSFVEGGFSWVPAFGWRMDKAWAAMRDEVPHVKRPPSEYLRHNIWFTTQPMEEPNPAKNLTDTLKWIGTDQLMFSTDYPHWDFDDPRYAFKVPLTTAEKAAIFAGNAVNFYGLN